MGIVTSFKKFIGLGDETVTEGGFDYEYSGEDQKYQELQNEATPVPAETAVPVSHNQTTHSSSSNDRSQRNTHRTRGSENMSNVIDLPSAAQKTKVLLMEPVTFEEMPRAVSALKERQSVVLNLTRMQPDVAQRSVDFVAGATYSMDGHQERIGDSIFLFAPPSVEVITQNTATDNDSVFGSNPRPSSNPIGWEEPGNRFAQGQF